MKKASWDTASRRHTFITVLEITVLDFLVLISATSATQSADVPNSGGNYLEKDIQKQDEKLRINPHD